MAGEFWGVEVGACRNTVFTVPPTKLGGRRTGVT